jgi:hypothetical protein
VRRKPQAPAIVDRNADQVETLSLAFETAFAEVDNTKERLGDWQILQQIGAGWRVRR